MQLKSPYVYKDTYILGKGLGSVVLRTLITHQFILYVSPDTHQLILRNDELSKNFSESYIKHFFTHKDKFKYIPIDLLSRKDPEKFIELLHKKEYSFLLQSSWDILNISYLHYFDSTVSKLFPIIMDSTELPPRTKLHHKVRKTHEELKRFSTGNLNKSLYIATALRSYSDRVKQDLLALQLED